MDDPAMQSKLGELRNALDSHILAIYELGRILDQEDDGPFRLQAINALTYVGQRALPVLPAIRRSTREDHRGVTL